MLYIGANNLYGQAMGQPLPYDEIKFDKIVMMDDILTIPDDSNKFFFIESGILYSDNIKKTKKFPFCLGNKIVLKINLVIL